MLKQGVIRALGAMSGTSLDGVDAAVLETDGIAIHGFGDSRYTAFTQAEQDILRAALGTWDAPQADDLVTGKHLVALSGFEGIDLVGFHGQTLAHDPGGRGTYQAGDGAVLARRLDLPVVWDFRSADVELGGQGAPLAPFYHWACARFIGTRAPVVFLNLGGVGNLTWVDPQAVDPAAPGALLAFDTGPANAPLNDLMFARRGQAFDAEGALAAQGQVDGAVLEGFLTSPYFSTMPPKSLDRNDFPNLLDQVEHLGDADAAATLTAIAAACVVQGLEHCPQPPAQLLVTGGGRRNATFMAMIAAGSSVPVAPVEEAGLDGDMLEAQAFAYLAVRVARGLPTSAPGTTGVAAQVGGGILSQP